MMLHDAALYRCVADSGRHRNTRLRYLVTGCAGFIGSTLTDRLLADGHEVIGYDNFSTGRESFLPRAPAPGKFRLVRGDLMDCAALSRAMSGVELVFHLAANADVRFGTAQPRRDLEQNTIATHNVLEAMRQGGVRRIAFASSGSVYGESACVPTPENAPFPVQTSLYGASKLAAEGLLAAYSAGFGFKSWIFRLVSILGERYTHGHICDFYRQLRAHPDTLTVLGDGRQRKSYLYVQDCVDAMLLATARSDDSVNIFNVGHESACELQESIGWISRALGVTPEVEYGGGQRGWAGDSPLILLDTARLRSLGWRTTLSIEASVVRTVRFLETHRPLADTHP
jgi:UDP-glucose 4-epimerase